MKLPENIKGRNRLRDASIVLDFKQHNMDYPELSEKYGLSERRVLQILRRNYAAIPRDPAWEKEKRINILERLIDKKRGQTQKDICDLLSEMRKELEGDKGVLVDMSRNYVQIYRPERYSPEDVEASSRATDRSI